MEATFRPGLLYELAPFDRVVLGEGERPLLELVAWLRAGASTEGVVGTAERRADGTVLKLPQRALDQTELRDAVFRIPYENVRVRRAHRLSSPA